MRVLTLYFMNGCPACAANKKAWKEAKKLVKGAMRVKEVERAATPVEAQVTSFPTMKIEDEEGREEKRIEGRQESGKEILAGLEIPLRRRTGGRTKRVRRRNLRHRTLRNHVALR
jgi:hypothetical protein